MAGLSAPDPKLIQIGINSEAVTEAWSQIWEKVSSTGLTVKDPSSLGLTTGLMSDIVMGGSAFFKFFGVADSINEFRKLWGWGADKDIKEKNRKHGLPMKVGLSALYILHAAASAIVASVILGASVVAAPIATAIVSSVAFAKSVGEYFKVRDEVKRGEKDVKDAEAALKAENVDLERNLALRDDLMEAREEIAALKEESAALNDSLSLLQSKDEEPEESLEKLSELSTALESELSEKIDKNKILADQSAKPDAYSKRSVTDAIENSKNKIVSFSKEKENLLAQIEKAKKDPKTAGKIEGLNAALKKAEEKIQKHTILQVHFEKIKGLETSIEDLKNQKGNLDNKYAKSPSHGQIEELKNLEKEYLELRIGELEGKLKSKMDPSRRQEKVAKFDSAKNKIESAGEIANKGERRAALESALKENFENQKKIVDEKLNKKKENYDSKEKYTRLFTNDPNKSIEGNVKSLFDKTTALIDKKCDLKKSKLMENKKKKNMFFTASVAALAIASCVVWPLAATFAGVMLGIGIAAGISSLWDKYKERKLAGEKKKETQAAVTGLQNELQRKVTSNPKKTKDLDGPSNTSPTPVSPTTLSKEKPMTAALKTEGMANLQGALSSSRVEDSSPLVEMGKPTKSVLTGFSRERSASAPGESGRNKFLKTQGEPESQTPANRTRSTSMKS